MKVAGGGGAFIVCSLGGAALKRFEGGAGGDEAECAPCPLGGQTKVNSDRRGK